MRLKLPLLGKTLAAAVLVCAVLASAGVAARSTSASVKLAVVPLPKSAIGPAAAPLELSHFSGVVSNEVAASLRPDVSADSLARARISGYMLDYGHAASGGSGITNVRTSIERYKTSRYAKVVFGDLKQEDAWLGRHLSYGILRVKSTAVKVPALGKARFAYLTTYRAANIVPFSTLDERILEGNYVLQAQVSAGTAAATKALAPKLAKKLDARFKLALKGHLHTTPVQLPPEQTWGPPLGGPDLAAFGLSPGDLGPDAELYWAGYGSPWGDADGLLNLPRNEISHYEVYMVRKGTPWDDPWVYQQIEWYETANEAAFRTDKTTAHILSGAVGPYVTLDLSSVGHGVQAVTKPLPGGHYDVEIMLNVGQLAEVVWPTLPDGPVQPSDVLPIVQAAANHIDAHYTP
jgi:hypothetical protein